MSEAITREQIDTWLAKNCAEGLPYGEATTQEQAIHGLAYVLGRIEGTNSYRPLIGQTISATTAIRWALDFIATQAILAALNPTPERTNDEQG